MPTLEQAPQPVTELLQIRTKLTAANSLQRDSSVSTPTPSTTPEVNHLQGGTNESVQNEQQEMVSSSLDLRV